MAAIAERGHEVLRGPAARIRASIGAAAALADGTLTLTPGDDGAEQRAALLAMPGIGPWTADYVRMRVLGDPDVFLPGDVAVRSGAAAIGIPSEPRARRLGRPHRALAQLPHRAPVARRATRGAPSSRTSTGSIPTTAAASAATTAHPTPPRGDAMTTATIQTIDTPDGAFTIVADDRAACSPPAGPPTPRRASPASARDRPSIGRRRTRRMPPPPSSRTTRGDLTAIDDVEVAQRGTAMQLAGWKALRRISPGAPLTYASSPRRSGQPSAVRAAASICARNAPALFVPCHRVLRSDGSLGGFAWGLPSSAPARP